MRTDKSEALHGVVPHSQPTLGSAERRIVAGVIRSGHLAAGDFLVAFERALADSVGQRYAAGVSSGTAALHLTLLAMGIGPSHEVIIPSYVCTALLNAVRYVGARPVLADIDPQTYNLDASDVKKRITRRTAALIVPHMFGLPADLQGLIRLGVPIIEDCAQAIGSTYAGRPVGSFGRAAVFSFYATKVITSGEGGMIASGSKRIIARIKDLRDYDEKHKYRLRYNYKMTEMQAALGLTQLQKLKTFLRSRRRIARHYDDGLKNLKLKIPVGSPGRIYFRYVAGLESESGALIRKLRQKGIQCAKPVYRPLHHYLKSTGYAHSDAAWRHSISLPIYPALARSDAERVLSIFKECLQGVGG